MDWNSLSPEERLIAEQAVLNFRALNAACDAAPDGAVLNVCEQLALAQGREFLRRNVEATLQQQAGAVEKKVAPSGAAAVERPAPTAAAKRARS